MINTMMIIRKGSLSQRFMWLQYTGNQQQQLQGRRRSPSLTSKFLSLTDGNSRRLQHLYSTRRRNSSSSSSSSRTISSSSQSRTSYTQHIVYNYDIILWNRLRNSTATATCTDWCYKDGFTVSTIAAAAALLFLVPSTLEITLLEEQPNNNESSPSSNSSSDSSDTTTTTLLNWSGTHTIQIPNELYYEPETIEELQQIVQHCCRNNQAIRPMGSALSPNGIAFNNTGMISMIHLNEVTQINVEQQTVTVQAGARVSQVIDQLRPYHLTLPNLASIAEQQMGGFISVGAHGTGKCISPIDQYVLEMKLLTPSQGLITLSSTENNDLFQLAKVGLGCLGIITEMTIQCIPSHQLREHTFCLTRQEAIEQCTTLLNNHRHMRYMWIPYTDTVVCVTNDPVVVVNDTAAAEIEATTTKSTKKANFWNRITKDVVNNEQDGKEPLFHNKLTMEERLQPMIDLLIDASKDTSHPYTMEMIYENNIIQSGFGTIRDILLAIDPLNVQHIQRCNVAEAEFWKRNEDYCIKPSDELLQFDCGGQQWVWEVCFPTGTQELNNGNDMRLMEQLLRGIEQNNIPAPAPIEQRWSASSTSYMSPTYYDGTTNGLYSWVGIINYLPSDNVASTTPEQEIIQRQDITALFTGPYCDLLRQIGKEFDATSHWAKLEIPKSLWDLIDLQLYLTSRFPIDKFNLWRSKLDPKNLLASPLINTIFGKP